MYIFIIISKPNELYQVTFIIQLLYYMPIIIDLEEFIAVEALKFDFKTIRNATDSFSQRNKLGQGGFGGVYKVQSCNQC